MSKYSRKHRIKKEWISSKHPSVDFSKLRVLSDVGENPDEQYDVIVIGYPYDSSNGGFACPGSRNAKQAINEYEPWQKRHLFITIPFGSSDPLRRYLNYSGTFPIVFCHTGKNFMHVGGGDSLLMIVRQKMNAGKKKKSRDSSSDDEDDSDSE